MSRLTYTHTDYLIVFEECKLVQGYYSSLLYDLTRPDNSNEVPKSFVDFYKKAEVFNILELIESYPERDRKTVYDYIDFVIERQFGVISDKYLKDHLEKYPTSYDIPSLAENAIIIMDRLNIDYLQKIIDILDEVGTEALELRVINFYQNEIYEIEKLFNESTIETIIIQTLWNDEIVFTFDSKKLIRIKQVNIYNSPYAKKEDVFQLKTKKVNLANDWSREIKKPFVIDKIFYINSLSKSNYFYSKIFFDINGEIKNAHECEASFGLIQDLEEPKQLKEIIQNSDFQKYWFVHKGIMDVCQDCEFRHMCLDNRLPYKRSEKEWYHKIECNYNPYIAKWEGEEGYKTLAESGVISNESEFTIDHDKIAEINAELWPEE